MSNDSMKDDGSNDNSFNQSAASFHPVPIQGYIRSPELAIGGGGRFAAEPPKPTKTPSTATSGTTPTAKRTKKKKASTNTSNSSSSSNLDVGGSSHTELSTRSSATTGTSASAAGKRRTKKDPSGGGSSGSASGSAIAARSSTKKNIKTGSNSSSNSGNSNSKRATTKSSKSQKTPKIETLTEYNNDYNEDDDEDSDENSLNDGAPKNNSEVKSVLTRKFDTVYQRGRKLGLGAFAVVFIGTHRPTQTQYAVKQIDRSTMFWGDRDALQDEISNLKLARSGPNIVQLYEVYEEKAFCYLIMEVMEGGELLECIIEKKETTFTEREARSAIRCVLRALAFLHENRIAHRDIKPENLLLSDPYHKDLNSVKLADFSFARKVIKKNDCRTLCGTPGYLSPEMLERFPAYDVKCDVWSVGCLLFLLLGGYLPFDDDDDDIIFDLTRDGQFEFRPEFWNCVSTQAKELVTKMLTVNPKKRISSSKALQSFWIEKGDTALEERQLNIKKLQNLVEGKRKFKTAISTLMTVNRVKMLNDDFKEYLGKRTEDNLSNKITKKKKRTKNDYIEDSLTGRPFGDFYEIGDELGEGGYAFVYRCEHKRSKDIYAVKEVIISKMESGGESTLKDEIAALKLLRGGAHIIRLFDVFYEDDHCFMIMEEMRGGDLLSRICDKEVYTEREARGVCKILFEAILYCHQKRVAHRDIKPENLLMVVSSHGSPSLSYLIILCRVSLTIILSSTLIIITSTVLILVFLLCVCVCVCACV